MKVQLLFPEGRESRTEIPSMSKDALRRDLDLRTLALGIAGQDEVIYDATLSALFIPLWEPELLQYRREALEDVLAHPEEAERLYEVCLEADRMRRSAAKWLDNYDLSATYTGAVDYLLSFSVLLRQLRGLGVAEEIKAQLRTGKDRCRAEKQRDGMERPLGVLVRHGAQGLEVGHVEALAAVGGLLAADLPQQQERAQQEQQTEEEGEGGVPGPGADVVHRPNELREQRGEKQGDNPDPPALPPQLAAHFLPVPERLGAAPERGVPGRIAAERGQLFVAAVPRGKLVRRVS